MTSVVHIAETALLLLVAYLAGCILGYGVHRILHAGRGTRQPTVVAAPIVTAPPAAFSPTPKPPRTPAARLAAAHEPVETRPTLPKPEPKPKPAPKPKRQPADPRPPALDAPRGGQADNLKQIKGIGPKIEASLNGLGIYHLDQIAAWTKSNIDWVDSQLAFKGRIRREQWVEQATELTKAKVGA
ncbi:hypothetical protein [Devosia sp. SL43]|uniref:hypothetical protein n=1 Tax=Devosia sp. SL43 TaxID=2806348 RepID=UPI001F2E7F1A|nr:hypothetical protein [Devosia sp. SL43]UJW85787.1 hypothetical protein IM737_00320 [Devosia sp. SL43]